MTCYTQTGKSLTHPVGHDAEQDHKQVPTRLVSSDQAGSSGSAARGLRRLQHRHRVGGGQCDKNNAGHNSGNV